MASANAAPPPALVVEWDAPPDCPNAEQVRGAVWAAVGSTRPSRSTNVTARAVVTEGPAGGFTMRLSIETDGASETKTVDAAACGTLADAYAVIVAFRFDPETAARAPAPVQVEPPEHEAVVSPPASRPRARVLRLGAGPVVATSAGVLPFPAFGIGAAVEAEYGMRWSLGAAYWPPQKSWASGSAESHEFGAVVQLLSAQPSACLPVAGGALAFCGGVELGAMFASGTGNGLVSSSDGISPWISFTGGVELEVPVAGSIAVRVRLDGGVPAFRPSFTLENAGSEGAIASGYQPGPVFALLRVEPLFRFSSTDSAETRHDRP
jgi:hypothetical protein